MKRLAVIGLGAVGQIHAANISNHERVELYSVCDIRPEVMDRVSSETGAKSAKNLDELMETKPDAILISSSTATHGEIVRECVASRIPFLCEKPLAQEMAIAEGIVRSVDACGLVAAVALNRRFDRQYARMRQAILSGEIGRCELICFTSRSVAPPTVEFSKSSGGLFAEKGSHFFDLARWITGDEPEELFAMGAVLIDPGYREIGEHDTAVISVRMRGGTLCRFDFSWRTSYGQDERIEVHGSNGLLTNYQENVGSVILEDGDLIRSEKRLMTWQQRFAKTYQRELDAFLSVLDSGKPHSTLATLNDGLMAQRMSEAARTSAAEGERFYF